MTEDGIDVFEEALGLEWPWYIDRARFDGETRTLLIHLDFESGGTFACGACGHRECKAYDTVQRQWRHLDFFGYRTFLQGLSPRAVCPSCGIRQAALPWARSRQRFTLPFEELVVSLAQEMSIRSVARFVGEHDTRLWRVINHYAQ